MTMPQPSPPTAEERDFYFYGLPSCPKFVARSTPNIWVNPQKPHMAGSPWMGTHRMYPKVLRPVGRYPLLHQLWNDAKSSLRIQILEAVNAADWTAIDILRIKLNGEYQITLLIAVKPDTLSWSRGYAIALECKCILEKHGIHDVQCEICESTVKLLCAEATSKTDSTINSTTDPGTINSTPRAPKAFQLYSGPIPVQCNTDADLYADKYADMSDCLGTKMAMKHMDYKTSTKGLYLSLPPSPPGSEPRILALTCRHAVIDPKMEGEQTYQQSEPFKEAIQIDQPSYEKSIDFLTYCSTSYLEIANNASEQGNANQAAEYNLVANNTKALAQSMKPYNNPLSRVIGRLLYSPKFEVASSGGAWVPDWALIELLASSHQSSLGSIRNRVYVGTVRHFVQCIRKCEDRCKRLPEYFECAASITNGALELQKSVVPMEELLNPPNFADDSYEPGLFVGKYGANEKLTFGLGNTLVSVVRHLKASEGDIEREFIGEEWAIMSATGGDEDPQTSFAWKGDSGSVVWDMQGRPAGIITSGNSCYETLSYITYAQPLERLLTDIRFHGFDVSLV